MNYAWVAVGAALGGMLRYWCSGVAVRLGAETFPWGTLFINVIGSAFIGFFATLTDPGGRAVVAPHIRLFVMTGICGGFTTFSAFSLEALRLAQGRHFGYAVAYIAASLVLCLLGVWLGHALAAGLSQR